MAGPGGLTEAIRRYPKHESETYALHEKKDDRALAGEIRAASEELVGTVLVNQPQVHARALAWNHDPLCRDNALGLIGGNIDVGLT